LADPYKSSHNRFVIIYPVPLWLTTNIYKRIVQGDFDGLFMILSYSLDVRHVLHHIFFSF
jgi:hypothetical protein